MATPTPDSYTFTPGTTLYAGLPTPATANLLQTLTFENELGSTQAGEWFSPMFGMSFEKGDLPAGQAPQFKLTNGTPVEASIWNVASWNDDGSVEQCSCLIRVPSSVASGSSLDIEVYSAGTFPAANGLTLASANAADLKLEVTGVTNLTGDWTCSLNDGITRNNHVVLLGSGDAGSYYKVGCEFRDGSAAAHGQLYGWFYVFLMRNSAGGFAGMRHLLRAGQVWADVTSPTTTMRRFTAQYKTGGTLIRDIVPITSTDAFGRLEYTGTQVACNHYSTFYACGVNAEYDFHQSGGTLSADSVMHLRRIPAEFVATRIVPPIDTTTVVDPLPAKEYHPYCKGNAINYGQDSQGEFTEIGVLPGWAATHVITQNKNDETGVRVTGLAAGGYIAIVRRVGTKQIPPIHDIRASYAGLGAFDGSARFYQSSFKDNTPAAFDNLHGGSDETDHRPCASYYAYVHTGEQQYLDQLVEIAHAGHMWFGGSAMGGPNLRVTPPITTLTASGFYEGISNATLNGTTYKCGGPMVLPYLARTTAWMMRDLQLACAVYPDTCPEGTETRLYFRDVVKSNFDLINAYNAAMVQSWRDDGLYIMNPGPDGPWSTGYMSNTVCMGTTVYPTTEGVEFRQHISKMWERLAQDIDFACVCNYHMIVWKDSTGRIQNNDLLTFRCPGAAGCTFNATTNIVTRVGTTAWMPTNGDRFCFDLTYKPFGGTDTDAIYYVVNASGADFQLAATQGGAPLDIVNGATDNIDFSLAVADFRPGHGFQNATGAEAYYPNLRSVVRFHNACGDDMTAALAFFDRNDLLPVTASLGVLDFSTVPKFAFAKTYPA